MTRQEIVKFYENKIDDVADETKREELLEKLDEIDDMIFELDSDIDEELENQEAYIIDDEALQDEFNYSNRMPYWEMKQ